MKLDSAFINAIAVAVGLGASPVLADETQDWPKAIEDNSFFVEEAYNQEHRVVQHISTLWHDGPGASTQYGFTQEWPLGSQRHQLSYTIGYGWGDPRGVGEALLNYRYQWTDGDDFAAVAPRVSLVSPPDDHGGRGPLGLQLNLPVSKRISPDWVLHLNVGGALRRGVATALRDGDVRTRDLRSGFVGASAIWLVTPRLNLMLETVYSHEEITAPTGARGRERTLLVSPGLRRAFDIGSLQVVPGVAVPWRLSGPDRGLGAFVYLSLEHPF